MGNPKTIICNYLLETPQYMTSMLPVHGESWNYITIILAQYMVPQNTTNELSNVTSVNHIEKFQC